ncbi:flagellar export protein FliJ [uncultured Desulfuromonas sp.]|uniref:flagellar export protein FliJ n=1 Tax=uncultured Desulfuromonas sp. TaxID=181013 RepID=UPI002AAAA27E|nr:flagellar export protein FliJ [uncultured Desulfuromonas sp.]
MKPFKLQVVLDHRQRLVDQARQHLAKALQDETNAVDAVTECRQNLDQVAQEYEQRQQQGMLAHEFMLYENQLNHQRERLERLEEQVVMARQHTLTCRKALEEAGREKKLLEKVKEKQQRAEIKEQKRREMAEIDEIAIMFRDEDES